MKPNATLALPCGSDSVARFYDDTAEGGGYVKHALVDTVKYSHGYFVARSYYEGDDWLFVSKRYCSTLDLFGPVVFNPAKTRFASVGNDNEAGFSANGTQILSESDGSVSLDLQDKMSEYGATAWRWKDDSTFTMDIKKPSGSEKKRTYALREGTWQIRNE